MTDVEDDTNSWKDRCNRYFTSLTDSEDKPGRDLKEENQRITNTNLGEKETWKSLSELKKLRKGSKSYFARRTLGLLDIHGARLCSSSKTIFEFVAWLVIIIACVTAAIYLIYLQTHEYNTQIRTFETTELQTRLKNIDSPMVSLCNKNILKKSSIMGTRFNDLITLENGNHPPVSAGNKESVSTIINSNGELKTLLKIFFGDSEEFITELEDEIIIKAFSAATGMSVMESLALNGNPEILRQYLEPSLTEMQIYGHRTEHMLLRCIIGGRECKESEIQSVFHKDLGSCVTLTPSGMTNLEQLEVITDVESDEYLGILTPSVGVSVIVHSFNLTSLSPSKLRSSTYTVSPNSHLDINILKESSLQRIEDTCRKEESYDKELCLETCLHEETVKTCGCRPQMLNHNTSLSACRNDMFPQHVCIRAVHKLQVMGKLFCDCPEKCSETTYETKANYLSWPSEKSMKHIQSQLKQTGKSMDSTYIRKNLLKVSVNLQPAQFHLVKEREPQTLLEMFALIGGLSALIAGISMLTLVELLWTALKSAWYFISHFRQRNDIKQVQRLSDSEITSITWAMHRIKRRDEELRKEREIKNHSRNNKNERNVFTGNVQNRIARRNSYLAPVKEEPIKPKSKVRDATQEKFQRHSDKEMEVFHYEKTGYGKNNDCHNNMYRYGRGNMEVPTHKFVENPHPRLMRVSRKTPDNSEVSKNNLMHLEGIYRPASHQIYYESVTYPQIGRLVTPADAIQLYGGSSAYLNPNQISEPMYI